jgi:hypothetical protein
MFIFNRKNLLTALTVTAALAVGLGCAPPQDGRYLGGPANLKIRRTAPQASAPYQRDGGGFGAHSTAPQALTVTQGEERSSTAPQALTPAQRDGAERGAHSTGPVAFTPSGADGGGTDILKEISPPQDLANGGGAIQHTVVQVGTSQCCDVRPAPVVSLSNPYTSPQPDYVINALS